MDISVGAETCILCALAMATMLSAQSSSTPIQLPASGRGLQRGSVGTTQSTVNAGGQNSVNLIDSSVNVQGAYLGSVPTGTATDAAISLSLPEALRRALDYNLGIVSVTQGVRQARAQRLAFLSQLLPEVNGNLRETVQQTDFTALGFRPSLFPKGITIPAVVGPYN